ncbi:MAG TPA: ATP-binding protein [Caulobacteraceae bacterium]|jgi:signal transduction histidine kinase/ActR/RegA family two-component response regulator
MRPLPALQRICEPQDLAQLEPGRLAAICRAWLGCSGDLVLLLSDDGRISHAASAAASLPEGFLPRLTGAAWRSLWPKAFRRPADQALAEAAVSGAGRFQAPLIGADGDQRWFDVTVAPVANANPERAGPERTGPERTGRLAVLRDISALKQEDERQAQSRRLEAVGRLAGGVAHDFNNLLTVILSAAESLIEGAAGDETRTLAETSLQAAERGAELIRRLLAFARPRPGAAPASASADAGAAVDAAARLLQRVLPGDVALDARAPAGLIYCRADRGELENALLNLCVNARDAMPKGGRIALGAELRSLGRAAAAGLGVKPGDYAVFAVEDDGLGMSPETAARAVEPFFSTKAAAGGTGLGLSAVNSLAISAGGALQIRSRLGEGARVELWLPRAKAAAQGQLDLAPAIAGAPACDILLVEDDPAVRAEAARLLTALGCRVTAAEDAEGAMDALTGDAAIDLMITDVGLPYGLDGRALAEAARALRPDLKTLFVSGYGAEPAPDFLPKPFGRSALAAAIQRQFARPSTKSSPQDRTK